MTTCVPIVTKLMIPIVAAAMVALAWFAQPLAPASRAHQTTPPAPVVIASEVLGRATPAAVADAELALGRVTIMPGAAIPIHDHAGTQIGVVVQGELTYTVFTWEIAWHRGDAPDASATMIEPGQMIVMRVGDAVVEPPGSVPQGRNDGDVPTVIYLSTLFPADAPRAITVHATPTR